MGAKTSILYSVPALPREAPDETEIFRHPNNQLGLFQTYLPPNIDTLQDLYIDSCKKHGNRLFLGSRSHDGYYTFRTYEECFEVVSSLGEAILKLGLQSRTFDEDHDLEMDSVGIFSKNREEWVLTDLACMINGIVTIPFFETVAPNIFAQILDETNITSIFCSYKCLEFILNQPDLKSLETVICFDTLDKSIQAKIKERGLDYCNFNDLLQYTATSIFKLPRLKPNHVYTISYTSGTGFDPKGVIITHKNMISALVNAQMSNLNLTPDDVHLSYLPLAHIFERFMINVIMCNGCRIGIYNGEIMKLKIDIADLKPTIFISVPKMFNKLFNSMYEKVNQLQGISKFLFEKGLKSKISNYEHGNGESSYFWDKLVFSDIQKELGTSFKWMLSAAAPISPSVLMNLKLYCSCPILEAYGLTESTGGTFISYRGDNRPGVYGTSFNVEFKLKSEGNMDYSVEYKDSNGENRPRGELMIRGPGVSMGYFKNQKEFQINYKENGWLSTGDIVELDRKEGSLTIIDRKRDFFKLAFGEYIAPGKIEKIYMNCKCIRDVCVYGNPVEDHLVGIVTCDKEWLICENLWDGKKEISEVLGQKNVMERVLSEMDIAAKEGNLFNYEKVKKIHLIHQTFEALGLLTPTFKLKRFEVKKMFADVLNDMYKK